MLEFQLSTRSMEKTIVRFDGHVLDFFFDQLNAGSARIHLGHIKSIELVPVGRGKEKYALRIHGEYELIAVDCSEDAYSKAQELVAEVKKAMASLRL